MTNPGQSAFVGSRVRVRGGSPVVGTVIAVDLDKVTVRWDNGVETVHIKAALEYA